MTFKVFTHVAMLAAQRLASRVEFEIRDRGHPTLLCMNRAVLSSDIGAMREFTNLNFATIGASEFEALFLRHVPNEFRVQSFYTQNYLNLDKSTRDVLKGIARKFLHATAERARYDAILLGNCDYWQDEMIYDVCCDDNMPVFVLCRESCVMGAELQRKRYAEAKYIFRGTAMAVDSETTQDVLLSTGGFKEGSVHVTGWPRFDKWVNFAPRTASPPHTILLVAYQEDGYLAPKNFVDVLKCFVSTARQSGNANRFCIKLKKQSHVKKLLSVCPRLLFSGIRIVSKTPLDELIKDSAVVIGYNTTGVLEGYLSDAAVVVPWWGDSRRDKHECLISESDALAQTLTYFPKSVEMLQGMLVSAIQGKLPSKGSPELRLKYFRTFVRHEPPEYASMRFERMVMKYLDKASKSDQLNSKSNRPKGLKASDRQLRTRLKVD